MHLKRLRINNFRSIENIDVEFDGLVNVIIGPNAVGKTTILEAIRLAKAVLAPRTPNEAGQTLNSLGITSPHIPQRLFPRALTNDPSRPTSVKLTFKPDAEELAQLRALIPQLGPSLAQATIGINFANPGQAMAFFSTPQGSSALEEATKQIAKEISEVEKTERIELNLMIDFQTGAIAGEKPVQQRFFAALEQGLRPTKTLFSYFPADRAMPIGEQPVQLGAADTNQQLESYNSQPQLKYARLKHTIFSSIIGGADGLAELRRNFDLIFDRILKGRCLGEIGLNEIGMLSIPIVDKDTNATFDIDGLSSGEKGLILTFLLIAKSVEKNGIVLLDEPELHLNPAVCRDLLQFLVDEYAVGQNVQTIICSHSTEILAGAFERDQCSLFHLRSSTELAKVRQHDQGEIRDALRRLGTSESEALLYRGTISVEGIHDSEVLHAGFDHILRRYRLKERGGRSQVEKDIQELQRAEANGDEIGCHFFIFDHDRRPTSLSETDHVKILQLPRFCLENFLLDVDIITDLTREREFSDSQASNTTQIRDTIKKLARKQINEVAARQAFKELHLEHVRFDMSVLLEANADTIAEKLKGQIIAITRSLQKHTEESFQAEFRKLFDRAESRLLSEWDEKWYQVCNGKRIFEDMRRDGHIKGDLLKLKRRIMTEMKNRRTEAWSSLESLLSNLLGMR